jgi:general secretion pathway protein F
MAVFEYRALNQAGKNVRGMIDADSPVSARRKLREQNLHPTNVNETTVQGGAQDVGQAGGFGRVSPRDVGMMTRQLAVLLEAGMPLVEALTALMDQTSSPRLRKHIFEIRDRVNEGSPLADAMAEHRRVFPELYTNMVRAGEASGRLEQVLLRLADIMERQVRLSNKVKSLLAYPVIMSCVSIVVVTFLMVVIVPQVVGMIEKQGQELPWITKLVIATSKFLGSYRGILLLLALIVLLGLWRAWVSRPEGRRLWDAFKLKVPLYSALHAKMICGRFSRTLGTMLESGLNMMTALDVVKTVVQNRVVEESMDTVKSEVRRGRDLAHPLQDTGHFPPLLVHMIQLGQRSGRLEQMLVKVADTYDEDVELTVNALVSLLEPLIIVVMGVFVGILVIAILLPILSMSGNI